MNLDEFKSIETHWIALVVNNIIVIYFDIFGLRIYQKKLKNS